MARSFSVLGFLQIQAGKIEASCEAPHKGFDVSQTAEWKEYFATAPKENCSK